MAVVEVEMEGAGGIAAVGGGVRGAEPGPFSTVVERDHRHMG